MVRLDIAAAENVAFVQQQPLVVVFVGATNGIGEFTLRELCKTHGHSGPGLQVILVGRNAHAARDIIHDCTTESPKARFHFVQIQDLSLLREVDKACDEVTRILQQSTDDDGMRKEPPQIDMLIMSQGKVEFGGRKDTKEGLDKSMSLLYYSRARCISKLLANLLRSTLPSGAKVVSIYAAGMESQGKLFPTDLSLDQPTHYTFANCRTHCIAMKTMFFEHMAERYAGRISLTHVYPGLVVHSGFDNPDFPWWFRFAWKLVKPFSRLISIPHEVIGQRILFLCTNRYPSAGLETQHTDRRTVAKATNGVQGGGCYSVTHTGETCNTEAFYKPLKSQMFRESVMQHTQEVFAAIEGQVSTSTNIH